MRFSAFLLLVACRTVAPAPESPRADEPLIDAKCLSHGRAGTLISSMPDEVGAFKLARLNENTITLRRAGRQLTSEEGTRLGETRAIKALSSGSSPLYSTTKCSGVGDGSCLTFGVWLCQSSLGEIMEQLGLATAEARAPDGELFVTLTIHEATGPAAKRGHAVSRRRTTRCPVESTEARLGAQRSKHGRVAAAETMETAKAAGTHATPGVSAVEPSSPS